MQAYVFIFQLMATSSIIALPSAFHLPETWWNCLRIDSLPLLFFSIWIYRFFFFFNSFTHFSQFERRAEKIQMIVCRSLTCYINVFTYFLIHSFTHSFKTYPCHARHMPNYFQSYQKMPVFRELIDRELWSLLCSELRQCSGHAIIRRSKVDPGLIPRKEGHGCASAPHPEQTHPLSPP